jgi:hypothetical protein
MVETTTIALVRLIERKDSYAWEVLRCPYCLKRHTHGAGYHGGDPRRLLGSRLSHCQDAAQRGTYELTEVKI